MWWCNEKVKELEQERRLCRFPSEDNKTQHKRLRNQTRQVVARAMRVEANQELIDLCQIP